MSSKRAEMGVEVIFYIMMSILMVAIIIFGINKIFFTKDVISEHERLEIQKELKEAYEYCEDPLNAGNYKRYEMKNDLFNSYCIFGSDFSATTYNSLDDFRAVFEGGDNIVLLKTGFHSDGSYEYNIMDSFKLDVKIDETFCIFDKNNTGVVQIKISCK